MPSTNHIYFFARGQADAGNEQRHLVGGKGASLGEMTRAGLQVPSGFTISAECCELYYRNNESWPDGLEQEVRTSLDRLERLAGRTLGRGDNPLLVAVRSGAAQSMPGMMDTVLNVGLNPDCVRLMGARLGDVRGAWEAFRHFLAMFGHTVAGVDERVFADEIAAFVKELGKTHENELNADELEDLCYHLSAVYRTQAGRDLPADPWRQLVEAIHAVFRSWNSERAITYRRHHHIDGLLGTAVNVQMMCPSEVSGVMFTANPINPALEQILIESSFGLGEAIVLGKVTPDRFVIDKRTLQIAEREISLKEHRVATIAAGPASGPVQADAPSLTDNQVAELARLGLRVENYFQFPCDIEWGISQGEIYLLQARAIKGLQSPAGVSRSLDAAGGTVAPGRDEVETVRRQEIDTLRTLAEPQGTVWSRFNLSEVLPEPTPMTWAIVRRFMSGKGGFGLMYRDLGFDPDPALDEIGIFDLVCGRPYCNLNREPRMQYRLLPFEHPFAALKADPNLAMYPRAIFNPARASWKFWLLLPVLFLKLFNSGRRLTSMSQSFATQFGEQIVPAYLAEIDQERSRDLSSLTKEAVLERLGFWTKRTLEDFARDSLKPTALAGLAMENLRRALERSFAGSNSPEPPRQRADAALRELVMGARPAPDTDLPGAINDLLAGRMQRDVFLSRFGHRGSQEMELSQPRWSEDHAALDRLLSSRDKSPARTLSADHGDSIALWHRLAGEAQLAPPMARALEPDVRALLTYMGLREAAKHYLMLGYAIVRRHLLELDRRYDLHGDIFFLLPEELPRLIQQPEGKPPADLVELAAQRRRRRQIALGLSVPPVLFSDDLEAIGRAVETTAAESLKGVPLSAGVVEGEAWVVERPDDAVPPDGPYILVCPSTDPAWVPLFIKAQGLLMETGGVLSHGAIVAREFGLAAVAGLPSVHRRLRTGQRLRVNGGTGEVKILT